LQAKIFCISVGFAFFSQLLSDAGAGLVRSFFAKTDSKKIAGLTPTTAGWVAKVVVDI